MSVPYDSQPDECFQQVKTMTVEFFGVNGFGKIGSTGKIGRSEKTGKAGVTGTDKSAFSATMDNIAASPQGTDTDATSRAAKIEQIKAQVAEGAYQPDLHKVATSLLKFLVEG